MRLGLVYESLTDDVRRGEKESLSYLGSVEGFALLRCTYAMWSSVSLSRSPSLPYTPFVVRHRPPGTRGSLDPEKGGGKGDVQVLGIVLGVVSTGRFLSRTVPFHDINDIEKTYSLNTTI